MREIEREGGKEPSRGDEDGNGKDHVQRSGGVLVVDDRPDLAGNDAEESDPEEQDGVGGGELRVKNPELEVYRTAKYTATIRATTIPISCPTRSDGRNLSRTASFAACPSNQAPHRRPSVI